MGVERREESDGADWCAEEEGRGLGEGWGVGGKGGDGSRQIGND